jgi:hypothetical protein
MSERLAIGAVALLAAAGVVRRRGSWNPDSFSRMKAEIRSGLGTLYSDYVRRRQSVQFRMTDEQDWEHRFESNSPEDLLRQVRESWEGWIATHAHPRSRSIHSTWALSERLREINAWLEERLSRPGISSELERSWKAQAATWRFRAKQELGGSDSSKLKLHVFSPDSDHWITPIGSRPMAPALPRVIDLELAQALWASSVHMLDYNAEIMASASEVADFATRRKPSEPLRLVDDDDGGEP